MFRIIFSFSFVLRWVHFFSNITPRTQSFFTVTFFPSLAPFSFTFQSALFSFLSFSLRPFLFLLRKSFLFSQGYLLRNLFFFYPVLFSFSDFLHFSTICFHHQPEAKANRIRITKKCQCQDIWFSKNYERLNLTCYIIF